MLSELAQELTEVLDATVAEMLAAAGVTGPPVDARSVADALGLAVAWDHRLPGRARFVRETESHGSIFLRPELRPERLQWAIAHELGEHRAAQVCSQLGVDPPEATSLRESIANQLANRLLLPTGWFVADAVQCDWDLLVLKARYSTASHELVARRMLEFPVPVIMSVFDQGRLTWRRGNAGARVPPLAGVERACWQESHRAGPVVRRAGPGYSAQCWPIHEAGWRREILRTEPIDDDLLGV